MWMNLNDGVIPVIGFLGSGVVVSAWHGGRMSKDCARISKSPNLQIFQYSNIQLIQPVGIYHVFPYLCHSLQLKSNFFQDEENPDG
jgi:hypothetical protein